MKLEIIRGFLKALKPIEGTYITVSTAFYAYEAKWKDENSETLKSGLDLVGKL